MWIATGDYQPSRNLSLLFVIKHEAVSINTADDKTLSSLSDTMKAETLTVFYIITYSLLLLHYWIPSI